MRITSKGQVTIPIEIRKKAGLRPNTEVTFTMSRGVVILKKATDAAHRGHRLVETMRGKATTGLTTGQILALTRRLGPRAVPDVLVDSNVILDVVIQDPRWFER